MKSVRSLLLCAALAGALAAPAADPVVVVRLRSVNAALAVARDASALAGQPFAAVMAESMLRSQIAQTGVELREDDPILLAVRPNPAPEGGSGELGMVGLLEDPPAMVFAVPAAPFPADLLEKMLDSTNAPAPGEWLANGDGDLFYAYRDGYALVAATADGRALAERLLAAKPARPDALVEFSIDEPAEFQRRMELGDAKEEAVAAACDAIAETLGLPGFGDKVRLVLDAAEKTDRETERYDVDVWFDPTNGLAFAVSRVAKEGSDLAARIAAVPALDPAALPGVPAGAPFWIVQAACESPEADLKAMLGAIRGLVDGPAPSGDAAATAQRAAAVRMLDANLAALPAFGAVAAYAAADAEGRPVFAREARLRDADAARTQRDAQAAFLESFPCLASNGVAVVREENGDVRIDVAIADAFVGVARLAHELERLEEEDDGSDLWVDDEEDDTEEDGEDGEKADEEEEDEVSNEPEEEDDDATPARNSTRRRPARPRRRSPSSSARSLRSATRSRRTARPKGARSPRPARRSPKRRACPASPTRSRCRARSSPAARVRSARAPSRRARSSRRICRPSSGSMPQATIRWTRTRRASSRRSPRARPTSASASSPRPRAGRSPRPSPSPARTSRRSPS